MDTLTELPNQFIHLVEEKTVKKQTAQIHKMESPSDNRVIISGNRNETLSRHAGFLRKHGLSLTQLEEHLAFANLKLCSPPLTENEVKNIAKSHSRYRPDFTNTDNEKLIIKKWNILEFMNDPSFKEPIPVVEGLFHLSEFHIISAPAKAGKSILLMNLAMSIAKGAMFLNKFKTYQRKVLYLQTEIGNFQLRKRFETSNIGDVKSIADYLSIVVERIKIDKEVGIERLKEILIDGKYQVLILDPFYTLHNSNEDSSSEMAPVLSDLRQVALDLNLIIIMVHHQGKRKEGDSQTGHKHRGSSSFADVPDGNISLRRTSNDTAVLDFELRNLETPESIELQMKDLKWEFKSIVKHKEDLSVFDVREHLKKDGEMSYSDLAKALSDDYGVSSRKAKKKISDALARKEIVKRKDGKQVFYKYDEINVDVSAILRVPKGEDVCTDKKPVEEDKE
jgi:hypothetical protein